MNGAIAIVVLGPGGIETARRVASEIPCAANSMAFSTARPSSSARRAASLAAAEIPALAPSEAPTKRAISSAESAIFS